MAAHRGRPGFITLFRSVKEIRNIRLINTIQLTSFSFEKNRSNYFESRSLTVLPSGLQLIPHNLNNLNLKRWKHDKKQKSKEDGDDDEDDEDNDGDMKAIVTGNKNAKLITTNVSSMRIDAIVKVGMGMARNKAETALYEDKLRINGDKVLKKSRQIKIDDMVDLVQGPSPKNPEFLIVTRLTVLDAAIDDDGYRVKMLREKSLVIENYEDPWPSTPNDS